MRSKRNVVVRAEAQKTIDMNEVSFTLRLILLIVFVALLCRRFLYSGMEKGSIFLLLLCLLLLLRSIVGGWDERYRRQNG